MHPRRAAAVAVLAFALAGCASATSSPSPSAPPGATPASSASQAPAPIATAVESPTPVAAASTATGAVPHPCELLSDEDVEQVTGGTVASRTVHDALSPYGNSCRWEVTSEGAAGELILDVMPTGGRLQYDEAILPFATRNDGVPIEGLGDAAIATSTTQSVAAVKGDVLVDLFWFGGFGDDAMAIRRGLVERAMEGVPA